MVTIFSASFFLGITALHFYWSEKWLDCDSVYWMNAPQCKIVGAPLFYKNCFGIWPYNIKEIYLGASTVLYRTVEQYIEVMFSFNQKCANIKPSLWNWIWLVLICS